MAIRMIIAIFAFFALFPLLALPQTIKDYIALFGALFGLFFAFSIWYAEYRYFKQQENDKGNLIFDSE